MKLIEIPEQNFHYENVRTVTKSGCDARSTFSGCFDLGLHRAWCKADTADSISEIAQPKRRHNVRNERLNPCQSPATLRQTRAGIWHDHRAEFSLF